MPKEKLQKWSPLQYQLWKGQCGWELPRHNFWVEKWKSAGLLWPCCFGKFYHYFYNFYKDWIKILSLSLTFTPPIYPNTDLICVDKCIFISIYTECVGVMCETNNKDLRYMEYKTMNMRSGRVGETHMNLILICIQTPFFSIRYWALKWWLNPLFWGYYSYSSLCNWYFILHGAASGKFFYLMLPQAGNREQEQSKQFLLPDVFGCWR